MIKKLLIANRGEVALRVIQTCREMDIYSVALYTDSDRNSLHVRRADAALELNSRDDFFNQELILALANGADVDAIHPGIGFMAEMQEHVRAVEEAGLIFVGPPATVMEKLGNRLETLEQVNKAGFPTVTYSEKAFGENDFEELKAAADSLGYPVVVKSYRGGRGSAERLVLSADHLETAVRRSQAESENVYGDPRVYLEKAMRHIHQVGVQVFGDQHGNLVHLGEREGSILNSNRKIVDESPAPCLNDEQRAKLHQTALDIAKLFNFQNSGTFEFLVDENGDFYFTEIKARLQTDHQTTEMTYRVDLVREQIRVAAGEKLSFTQEDLQPSGWSISCRVQAEDPLNNFLPSPGVLDRVRLPSGGHVRTDTYVYCTCPIPAEYSRLFAQLTVWGPNRETAVKRIQRALEDSQFIGTHTNISLLQQIVHAPRFASGKYDTEFVRQDLKTIEQVERYYRDLAVAAAIAFVRRGQLFDPSLPDRLTSGWHRASRRLPE